jgi:hypothetical protein
MEPFAIVSFVCSLLVGCGVGSIIAIVFGHIARQRIRRDGSDGGGLALAGLIIGYIGVAFTVLAVVAIVAISVFAANGDHRAANDAWGLDKRIVSVARTRKETPRSATVVNKALYGDDASWDAGMPGTDDDPAASDTSDFAATAWRLTVHGDTGDACLTIPSTPTARRSDITEGEC